MGRPWAGSEVIWTGQYVKYKGVNDTTVYLTGSSRMGMYEHLNADLNSLNDWFKANQLSANPTKTKYIHLHRRNCVINTETQLIIKNEALERVQITKFLGVIIDDHL